MLSPESSSELFARGLGIGGFSLPVEYDPSRCTHSRYRGRSEGIPPRFFDGASNSHKFAPPHCQFRILENVRNIHTTRSDTRRCRFVLALFSENRNSQATDRRFHSGGYHRTCFLQSGKELPVGK